MSDLVPVPKFAKYLIFPLENLSCNPYGME